MFNFEQLWKIVKIILGFFEKYKKSQKPHKELAKDLGFGLGKLNYCLKALKEKGLIKTRNFKKPNKINYFYVLTPRGISKRLD